MKCLIELCFDGTRAFDGGCLGCRSHEVQRETVDADGKL